MRRTFTELHINFAKFCAGTEERYVDLLYVIENVLIAYMQVFPHSNELKLAYVRFQIERFNNLEQGLLQLNQFNGQLTFGQKYQFFRLRKFIQIESQRGLKGGATDLNTYLMLVEMARQIEECVDKHIQM